MSRGASQATNPNRKLVRFLWIAVIFLALIGLAVATRRATVLLKPGALSSPRNPAAALDAHIASERTLVLTHILPAILFMILPAPLWESPGCDWLTEKPSAAWMRRLPSYSSGPFS